MKGIFIDFFSGLNLKESVAAIGIILGFILINRSWKKLGSETKRKYIGLLFVVAISLFSNNTANYFLALIIIATLVTELEFLQNIAAIIRNNKHYFSYIESQNSEDRKKSQKEKEDEIMEAEKEILETKEEAESKLKADKRSEIGKNEKIKVSKKLESLKTLMEYPPSIFGLKVEELTLNYLEKFYGNLIKRDLKIINEKKRTCFLDGVIEMEKEVIVIEVKTSRSQKMPLNILRKAVNRFELMKEDLEFNYKDKTVKYELVIVTLEKGFISVRSKSTFKEYIKSSKVDISTRSLTFDEIGLI